MTADQQLLSQYAMERSEAAFSELVARHVGLVYAAAFRALNGDVGMAQDVTQTVFIDLARKAQRLPQGVVLAGWLHRHTCYTAASALRAERRRRVREETAMEIRSLDDHGSPPWEELAPFLDESLDQLKLSDRNALVLRFLQRQDLRAVGVALGIREDAAQKRVSRALDKLRTLLGRRGIILTTGALASLLGTEAAVTAAPAGLAAGVTAAALSGTTTTTTAAVIAAAKASAVTALHKVIIGTTVAALVGAGIYEGRRVTHLRRPTLPPQLREQFERQKGMLNNLYLESAVSWSGSLTGWDYTVTRKYISYFDGNHFYEQEHNSKHSSLDGRGTAFDGQSIWKRYPRDGRVWKIPLADEDALTRFRFKDWPYLDAASIFAPGFIPEFEGFSSLEPLPLRYLEHGALTKVERVGENVRVTFRVEDVGLARVQHTDPAEYERELRRTPNTLQHNAAEIARVKLAKTLSARRTVAFLLDPRRNYAVLEREEWNATGQRVLRVESDQWTLYEPPGIWLPGRCVVFYYARPTLLIEQLSTHPIHVQTNRLTTVEFERKGISFTFEPGEPAGLPEPK